MEPIDFDESAVDDSLYEEERKGLAPVVWHGKHGGQTVGVWTLDRDAVEEQPAPFWEAAEVQFGGRPDAPLVPVWATQRLRVCVLGMRRRQIITDDAGVSHYYPMWQKREERVAGKFKSHTQVAVVLPGDDTVFALGLKGYSKTVCWDNSQGRYYNDKFPIGAWPRIQEYTELASKQQGKKIPALCTWWVDLVPAVDAQGKGRFVDVGNGVYMQPFVCDLHTAPADKALPASRFVGMDSFKRLQDIRREEVVPWEKEWHTAERMAQESGNGYEGGTPAVEETPEGEIPF